MIAKNYYEIVGIFSSAEELDEAVDELFTIGFDQSSLSVLADEATLKQKLGENYANVIDLADNPDAPRTFFKAEENIGLAEGAIIGGLMYIGAAAAAGIVIIKGGPLSHALTMAAVMAGISTAIGVILAMMVNEHHNKYIENQLKKGGLLLWIRLKDKSQADIVTKVLEHNHAINVHLRTAA